jgi:methylated-DNA-[protein]-cysteine S-methyltransferase
MEGVSPFFQRVYAIARTIPAGETLSYAELADRAGSPKAFRAVGQAMAKNPFPVLVPCHRVLAAGGKLGGFSAPGGTATKVRLLDLER